MRTIEAREIYWEMPVMAEEIKPIGALSLAECVDKLFSLKLAQYPKLKDALNSMVRNKLIDHHKTAPMGGKNSRTKVYYPRDQLTTMFNATLLHGVFADPRLVKNIFIDTGTRQKMAQWLRTLLMDRNSVVGIGLISGEVVRFLEVLRSEDSLREVRLANPFVELPQLSLGGVSSIMQGLLVQGAVLPAGDSMMVAYLNGELERAWHHAKNLKTEHKTLLQYQQLIIQEYEAAVEFDSTLDFFK